MVEKPTKLYPLNPLPIFMEENKVGVQDFNATLAHALGLPQDQIVMSPSGRPFTVADKGKPVLELF